MAPIRELFAGLKANAKETQVKTIPEAVNLDATDQNIKAILKLVQSVATDQLILAEMTY